MGSFLDNYLMTFESLSPLEAHMHNEEAETTEIKHLSKFCQDWEMVNKSTINSSNFMKAVMEFSQKRKVENVQSVIDAVKKIKGIVH